ncbi:hypothetical protein PUN28_007140 [Cardiocondyla obscurior]|uniref:Uncharacterized protein n=1 Tax=Cardiocondyla obscurior TaxID=286306 RepID=A0AAW2G6P8_9HYME
MLRRQTLRVIYRTVYIIEEAVVRRNIYIRSGMHVLSRFVNVFWIEKEEKEKEMSNRWQDIIFPKKIGIKHRIATNTNFEKSIYTETTIQL